MASGGSASAAAPASAGVFSAEEVLAVARRLEEEGKIAPASAGASEEENGSNSDSDLDCGDESKTINLTLEVKRKVVNTLLGRDVTDDEWYGAKRCLEEAKWDWHSFAQDHVHWLVAESLTGWKQEEGASKAELEKKGKVTITVECFDIDVRVNHFPVKKTLADLRKFLAKNHAQAAKGVWSFVVRGEVVTDERKSILHLGIDECTSIKLEFVKALDSDEDDAAAPASAGSKPKVEAAESKDEDVWCATVDRESFGADITDKQWKAIKKALAVGDSLAHGLP